MRFPRFPRLFLLLTLGGSLALAGCGAGGAAPADASAPAGARRADLADPRMSDVALEVLDEEIRLFVEEMVHVAEDLGYGLEAYDPIEDGLARDGAGFVPDPDDLPGGDAGGAGDGLDGKGPPSGFGTNGVAGQDQTTTSDGVTKEVHEDGSVTVTKVVETPDGAHVETVTHGADGSTRTVIDRPNGGQDTIQENADGSGYFQRLSSDNRRGMTHVYGPGRIWERTIWRRGRRTSESSLPPRWFNRNPGEDSSWWQKQLADWAWRQHRLGRHTPGTRYPLGRDLVNPGDPDRDHTVRTAPSIWDFVEDLVIDPDPTGPAGRGVLPSEQAGRILRGVLLELARGITPGGRPPRDDGPAPAGG